MSRLPVYELKTRNAPIRPIAIAAFDGVDLIDISGPMEIFAWVNEWLSGAGFVESPAYPVQVIANRRGLIKTSDGLQIYADFAYDDFNDEIDTMIVPGSRNVDRVIRNSIPRDWVCMTASRVRRLVAVCTGVFLLAEAGLLDGRRVTCHEPYRDRLRSDYPSVAVEADRTILRDGPIMTSSEFRPGIDLVLSSIEEDWGKDQANLIEQYFAVSRKCGISRPFFRR